MGVDSYYNPNTITAYAIIVLGALVLLLATALVVPWLRSRWRRGIGRHIRCPSMLVWKVRHFLARRRHRMDAADKE
ncbi:hypothetical protein BDZ89DRAFT_261762 [Hymenopellis radicata]|nr:hypothetical protein BDZ89DRAFT_261762 [Hymenopellis radicata]